MAAEVVGLWGGPGQRVTLGDTGCLVRDVDGNLVSMRMPRTAVSETATQEVFAAWCARAAGAVIILGAAGGLAINSEGQRIPMVNGRRRQGFETGPRRPLAPSGAGRWATSP